MKTEGTEQGPERFPGTPGNSGKGTLESLYIISEHMDLDTPHETKAETQVTPKVTGDGKENDWVHCTVCTGKFPKQVTLGMFFSSIFFR